MASRFEQRGGAKCEVPGCVRFCGKVAAFCNRCWAEATEDERAGLLFARHAPFWSRTHMREPHPMYRSAWSPGELVVEGIEPESDRWHGQTWGGLTAGEVMRSFEAATVQAALCLLIYDRRRFQFVGNPEGERP